jgi:hypothetical protein
VAGTFTHWMIIEEALNKFNKFPKTKRHKYFSIIKEKNHFVLLGAVGPDYPYLSELKGNLLKVHSWADRMHYENTGHFVEFAIRNLIKLNDNEFEICLSWLCGYVTHLIADSVIHPVVNSIVGPYLFNSGEHRHCEMTQDSYVFKEIKKVEIEYAEFLGIINLCSMPDNKGKLPPALKDMWTETLKMSHPGGKEKFDTIDPNKWHEKFVSIVENISDPIPIFRHIGEEGNLVYKKEKDITPEEEKKFIDEVVLPNGRTGKFKELIFDKTVGEVIKVWQKLFADIETKTPDNCLAYIKN